MRGMAALLLVCAAGCGGGGDGAWNQHPSPGTFGVTAVWSFAPDDVWAGSQIMLHFDGTEFTQVETPPIGFVNDFWGFAPDDLYAAAGALLHWDGTSWAVVAGTESFGATAVWGTSGGELFVGDQSNSQVHRWDGVQWTTAFTQVVEVTDLWGSSSTDVWAAGIFGLWHWDGVAWTDAATNEVDSATGLWGFGPDDVWAVDDFGVLARWNGSAWIDMLPVDDDQFEDDHTRVWGSSPEDVWAVGDGGLISHWDGAGWSQSQWGDFPYYPFFNAVHGSTAADVWIVGLSSDGDNTGVILNGP